MYSIIVLIAHAAPINILAPRTGMHLWKQALAVVAFLVFLLNVSYLTSGFRVPFFKSIYVYFLVTAVSVVLMVVSSVFHGFSFLRISYALLAYVGFLSMILVPLLSIYASRERQFVNFFAVLAIFGGLGLVVDYYFNVYEILAGIMGSPLSYIQRMERYAGGFRRAQFLFGAPTAVFPYLSLGLVCLFLRLREGGALRWKILSVIGILSVTAGLFLTGSRVNWVLSLLFIPLAAIGAAIYGGRARILYILAIPILIALAAFTVNWALSRSDQQQMLVDRAGEMIGGDTNISRFEQWGEGLRLFGPDASYAIFAGHGLGACMSQIPDGAPVHTHYESSILFTFYEGGFLGLFVRFWPAVLAFFIVLVKRRRSYLHYLIGLWVICYMASAFANPGAGAYDAQTALYIILGMAATSEYFEGSLAFGQMQAILPDEATPLYPGAGGELQ